MVSIWIIYGSSMDNLWITYGQTMDMVGGCLTHPSEKYEFVKWDDDILKWKNEPNVPNHQPGVIFHTMRILGLFSVISEVTSKNQPIAKSFRITTRFPLMVATSFFLGAFFARKLSVFAGNCED